MSEEKNGTVLDDREKTALEDDELDAVAGGGTYSKDGFLKTTSNYVCQHYECKYCGYRGKPRDWHLCLMTAERDALRTYGVCNTCKWHSTLRCNNPLNKKN